MQSWRRLIVLALGAALALGGCTRVSLDRPIINPADASVDSRLVGTWKLDAGGGQPVTCEIFPSTDGWTFPGVMVDHLTVAGKDGHPQEERSPFVTAVIEGATPSNYLSDWSNPDSQVVSWADIWSYRIVDVSTLAVSSPDAGVARALIDSHELEGSTDKQGSITLNRDSLVGYLQHHDGSKLFPAKGALTFKRFGKPNAGVSLPALIPMNQLRPTSRALPGGAVRAVLEIFSGVALGIASIWLGLRLQSRRSG